MTDTDMRNSGISSPAATVWSIPLLQTAILSYLPGKALRKMAILSKQDFLAAINVLYNEIEYEDFKEAETTCDIKARKVMYQLSVREFYFADFAPEDLPNPKEIFKQFDKLRIMSMDHGIYLEHTPSCTSTEKLELKYHTDYNITLPNLEKSDRFAVQDDPNGHGKTVKWNIGELTVDCSPEGGDAIDDAISQFLDSWSSNKGIFQLPRDDLIMAFEVDVEQLLETLLHIHDKGYNVPKAIHIYPMRTTGGLSQVDLLKQMNLMFEDVTDYWTWSNATTIYDFSKHKIDWTVSGTKVKRVTIFLHVNSDALLDGHEFDCRHVGPAVGLTEFEIVLVFGDVLEKTIESARDYLPQSVK
ncbi:uncharacterized protein L201_005900 [Kwoniella dendrophila CBS 6074]|uniref:F-box domain-containing protein n=1 Tax=Kwoniella dendrophila CBS 6074 TaxID=1295534 RepID=A0AAX4K023_9TREE